MQLDISLATDSGSTVQPQKVIPMYFAAAVTAGDVVMEDTATTSTANGSVLAAGQAGKKSTASADLAGIVGGAKDTCAAGTWGRVVISGVQTGVACDTVTAGDALRSSATAGRLNVAANTDINIVAEALTSASSNTCTVRWLRG